MTMQTPTKAPTTRQNRRSQRDRGFFRHPAIVALIGGICGIIGIAFGVLLERWIDTDTQLSVPSGEIKVVDAHGYPQSMGLTIERGDLVRVRQRFPDDDWNCGLGPMTIQGIVEKADDNLAPDANYCSIIYGIGEGDPSSIEFFPVGPNLEWEADGNGILFLGTNDKNSHTDCSHTPAGDCYDDNTGQMRLEIITIEK